MPVNNYINKQPLNIHLLPGCVKHLHLKMIKFFKLLDTEPIPENRIKVERLHLNVDHDYLVK